MISIVAVDRNWGIGKDGNIPWKIPGEQKFFKETTMGGVVVMGRKTFDSLPGQRPLSGRRNIVLTRSADFSVPDTDVCTSPESLFESLHGEDPDRVFLIGGAQIYSLMIPYCNKAIVTKIKDEFSADTYHPDLDCNSAWRLTDESDIITSSNGISYTICIYKNFFLTR